MLVIWFSLTLKFCSSYCVTAPRSTGTVQIGAALLCPFSHRACIEEPEKELGRGPERPMNAKWRVVSPDSEPMKSSVVMW